MGEDRYSVDVPEEEEFCKVCKLPTNSPLAVCQIFVDAYGGVWLGTNDGTKVVIPAEWRKLAGKWVREGSYR